MLSFRAFCLPLVVFVLVCFQAVGAISDAATSKNCWELSALSPNLLTGASEEGDKGQINLPVQTPTGALRKLQLENVSAYRRLVGRLTRSRGRASAAKQGSDQYVREQSDAERSSSAGSVKGGPGSQPQSVGSAGKDSNFKHLLNEYLKATSREEKRLLFERMRLRQSVETYTARDVILLFKVAFTEIERAERRSSGVSQEIFGGLLSSLAAEILGIMIGKQQIGRIFGGTYFTSLIRNLDYLSPAKIDEALTSLSSLNMAGTNRALTRLGRKIISAIRDESTRLKLRRMTFQEVRDPHTGVLTLVSLSKVNKHLEDQSQIDQAVQNLAAIIQFWRHAIPQGSYRPLYESEFIFLTFYSLVVIDSPSASP